ncbi:MAG: DUF1028 domain-containing protein [Planctomycetota bacterium]
MRLPRFRRLLALAATAALTGSTASATWSIVVVNTKTGEVCVAAATCIENFNLIKDLPVMRVGQGGAVSQGLIDFGAVHRIKIWDGFIAGDTPDEILTTLLNEGSSVHARQWGIVDFENDPVTYTGNGAGLEHHGVTGIVGDLRYAIQGNVITGDIVVTAAEGALLGAPGDLTQKVMAGMEAARVLGGDGRCSCTTGAPFSCGTPPPDFEKSAHTAFIVTSRMGDVDGGCYWALGCAQEEYYVKLAVSGDSDDIDPVIQLQMDYDAWRQGMAGHPDHLLSTVTPGATALVADGATSTEVVVRLYDVEGDPILQGGALVTVETEDGSTPYATPGAVVDNGDGTYTIPFAAGTTAGDDTFVIRVDDGAEVATLFPYLELSVDPLTDLHAGVDSLPAAAGGEAPFVLNLGAAAAGHPYILLGSISGTVPGIDLGGPILPLNQDWFLTSTLVKAGTAALPGSVGLLDAGGRAEASFIAPPGELAPFIGTTIHWAAVDYAGPLAPTSAVAVEVAP